MARTLIVSALGLGALAIPAAAQAATFTNSAAIALPNVQGNALLYPSPITVTGLPGGIASVSVTLRNFTHTAPGEVGVVLVAPNNDALLVQDGAGGASGITNVTYTLADSGATDLPNATAWAPGTYMPTSHISGDSFPAPGPGTAYSHPGPVAGGTATFAGTFNGDPPNGTWKLYVRDFEGGDAGSFAGGWSLNIAGDGVVPPPETTITSGPAEGGSTNDSSPAFGFSSSYTPSTFECAVDGGAFAACTSGSELAALADGPHTFSVRATDALLSVDPTPASRAFTVDTSTPPTPDTVAPETTITRQPPRRTKKKTANFEFSSEPGATFECSLDGGAFFSCTSPHEVSVRRGRHTFAIRALDPAANVDQTPATSVWRVTKPRRRHR